MKRKISIICCVMLLLAGAVYARMTVIGVAGVVSEPAGGDPFFLYGGANPEADGYTDHYAYGEAVAHGDDITIPAGKGGTLTKIGKKIVTANEALFSCRIYDTSNDAVSSCVTTGAFTSAGWNDMTVTSGPTLSASTTYRIICWTNGAADLNEERTTGGIYQATAYTNACANPSTIPTNTYEGAIRIEVTP